MKNVLAFPMSPAFQTMTGILLREASQATGLSIPRIKGGERSAPVAKTRFAIFWALREHSGMSLPQIGRAIGGRDHTTVMHAMRRARVLRDTDTEFKALCDRLEAVARAHNERAGAAL